MNISFLPRPVGFLSLSRGDFCRSILRFSPYRPRAAACPQHPRINGDIRVDLSGLVRSIQEKMVIFVSISQGLSAASKKKWGNSCRSLSIWSHSRLKRKQLQNSPDFSAIRFVIVIMNRVQVVKNLRQERMVGSIAIRQVINYLSELWL